MPAKEAPEAILQHCLISLSADVLNAKPEYGMILSAGTRLATVDEIFMFVKKKVSSQTRPAPDSPHLGGGGQQ